MKRVLDSDTEEESEPVSEEKSYPVTLNIGGKRPRVEESAGEPEEAKDPDQGSDEFELSPDESSSDSEEYSQDDDRRQMRRFVVNSDVEDDMLEEPEPRRRRRVTHKYAQQPRRSSRRLAGGHEYGSIKRDESSEDDDKAEVRAEYLELLGPRARRPTRELRQRERVNYRIFAPPPPEVGPPTKDGKPGKRLGDRRLFSVAGPFGGNEVESVFKPQRHHLEKVLKDLKADGGNNAVFEKDDRDPLGIETDIDFSSIGGLEDYIGQLKEMVTLPLTYPELYQRFGITPPRGVLFHGPPGTGKTLMARALAAMGSRDGRKITFFMRKGGDCLSKWVGEAERQLRVLFDEAKEKQPSIIFFDEIDGLAPVRSSKQDQIHASIVSTLLALMDGLDNRGQVVIIGATNRPDNIDPALRRPGRFDREFYFPLPNLEARKQIVQIHTKKWDPPLEPAFVGQIAEFTKGYGGADIKALCTESALNAIQRTYPQIYASEKKLVVHPETINVNPGDVLKALERILPSTVRGATSSNATLPDQVVPLLEASFGAIKARMDTLMPRSKSLTALEVAQYSSNLDFSAQRRLDEFKGARINRPRLLVHGEPGNGQEYIGSAIISYLEGATSHVLDLASLFSDSMRTPEATIVQTLAEARKRSPSVVLIPNIELWFSTLTPQALSIFFNCLRSFAPTDKVMVVGISNEPLASLDPQIRQFFGLSSCPLKISTDRAALDGFFRPLFDFICAPPSETMDFADRAPRVLPELPVAQDTVEQKQTQKVSTEKQDNRTRSQLKVKLGTLMDTFQKRYRRFKKPVVDDDELLYLFYDNDADAEHDYVRTEDDRIREVATDKVYHNMDLDVIEDRLWNGYYCEPRQFLQDLELIHEDSITLGDRERVHKSSEMVANAQVAIDEIESAFIDACRDLHKREVERELRQLEHGLEHEEEVAEVSVRVDGEIQGEVEGEAEGQVEGEVERVEGETEGQVERVERVDGKIEGEVEGEQDKPAQHSTSAPSEPSPVPSASPAHSPMAIEPVREPTPEFILPNLDDFKTQLGLLCKSLNLDQLETAFSALADIAWDHRLEWDRTSMITALQSALAPLGDTL